MPSLVVRLPRARPGVVEAVWQVGVTASAFGGDLAVPRHAQGGGQALGPWRRGVWRRGGMGSASACMWQGRLLMTCAVIHARSADQGLNCRPWSSSRPYRYRWPREATTKPSFFGV